MTTLLENPIQEKEGINVKVKVFSHNDLDGIGCGIVGKRAFGTEKCDVEYCRYEDIEDKVYKFLFSEDYENFDAIFITDISVGESLAEIINSSFADKVQLIDHHGTADWLNKYPWALVKVNEPSLPGLSDPREGRLASGTSLFFHYLYDNGLLTDLDMVDLVEQIRQYDTWEWKNVYNNQTANQLNILFGLMGRYKFSDRFVANPEAIFTATERALVDTEVGRIDRYIKGKMDKVREVEAGGFKIGVVFADQYHSELGNILAESNPQYDFIAMVNFGSMAISYRGDKDNIDIGKEFASLMGGGGHPKAAGSPIDGKYPDAFLKVLFGNLKTE